MGTIAPDTFQSAEPSYSPPQRLSPRTMSDQSSWYYSWDDRPRGPVDRTGLRVLAEQGFLSANSWIWCETWPQWQRLAATELRDILPSGPPAGFSLSLPALPLPSGEAVQPPPLIVSPSSKRRYRRAWRQFVFNLLVFCGAFAALAVSLVPLFSSVTLPFVVPIAMLAAVSLSWALKRKTSKALPCLSLLAAFGAVAIGSWNYRTENRHKPSLTELLAIHDRGSPQP